MFAALFISVGKLDDEVSDTCLDTVNPYVTVLTHSTLEPNFIQWKRRDIGESEMGLNSWQRLVE